MSDIYKLICTRLEDQLALKSIFKRWGNKQGSLDTIESAFLEIVQREETRKF